jgi:hypothetical protein
MDTYDNILSSLNINYYKGKILNTYYYSLILLKFIVFIADTDSEL